MSLDDQHSNQHHDDEQAASRSWMTVARGAPAGARPKARPIERILLPLDMSPYAERAIPYALALAEATDASITLAHVAASGRGRSASAPSITAYLATIREAMLAPGQRVALRIVRGATVVGALCDLAETTQTDVVAIATHARQGLEQPLLGKVGDHLIRAAGAAVLIAPPGLELPQSPPTFRRVLVPLDGSRLAEQALGPALTLAQRARAPMEIVLFSVEEAKEPRQDTVRYLAETRAALMEDGLPETVRVITSSLIGSPPGAVVGAATHGLSSAPNADGPFDLLIMATHGHGGARRWLYGSVAAYVIPRLTIPALLVHSTR
jgi:nucleotide-binding universal stress UspA family protein